MTHDAPHPSGCLGCNHDEVAAFFAKNGIEQSQFTKVIAAPRHAWPDVLVCPDCGQPWLMAPAAEEPLDEGPLRGQDGSLVANATEGEKRDA